MTLIEEWREFERNIVPADTDQIMRSKMRFLFYSGCLSVIDRLISTERTLDSVALYLALMHESHELANDVAAEYRKAHRL
jgi:hypothetical protein